MIDITAVQGTTDAVRHCDVAVIGGGIVGVSTAYELAKRGVSVALFEKGIVGGEQSGRNWGWVRQQNRDLYELRLAMHSLRRWGELGAELGEDLGFRRSGILYATDRAADVERWEGWQAKARELGFVSEMLGASGLARHLPGNAHGWVGGVWSATDGRAEPSLAAPAIARGAQRLGAKLYQGCAVRGLDIAAGRISGVWTETGRVAASAVVLAGGAWSALFCHRHGIALPAVNVVGSVLRTAEAPAVFDGCFSAPEVALRRRLDGGYTIALPGYGRLELAPHNMRNAVKFRALFQSNLRKKLAIRAGASFFAGPEAWARWDHDQRSPFERTRILDPRPDHRWARRGLANIGKLFPSLAGLRATQVWAGAIDTTPDLVPVISTVPQVAGLVIASGFSGHGFALGPGAGGLVAGLVTGDTNGFEVGPYRLDRFGTAA
ncbi:MAG: FAD-binding oxidoreductase, partial [Burkholderia gladioli]